MSCGVYCGRIYSPLIPYVVVFIIAGSFSMLGRGIANAVPPT